MKIELRELELLWKEVEDKKGRLVILSGTRGLGKTHTARQFIKRKSSSSIVLQSSARPQTQHSLYPIYEALVEYLKPLWNRKFIADLIKRYLIILPRIGTYLRPIFDQDSAFSDVNLLLPKEIREASPYPHTLKIITEITKNRPAIVFIDDFQWADRETLAFFSYLRDRLSACNIFWIICLDKRVANITDIDLLNNCLDYLMEPSLADKNRVHIIKFTPVLKDDFKQLVDDILKAPLVAEKEVLQKLWEKTHGVPLYLEIFLDILKSDGTISLTQGYYEIRDKLDELTLPATIRTAINEKLKRLYRNLPESKPILEAASVIGNRFKNDTLEPVTGLCNTYKLLCDIERDSFLVEEIIEQNCWEFDHVSTRDHIYSLLGNSSKLLHLKLAQYLVSIHHHDSSYIAYQFRCAGDIESYIYYQVIEAVESLKHGYFKQSQSIFDEIKELLEGNKKQSKIDDFEFTYNHALSHYYCSSFNKCLEILFEYAPVNLSVINQIKINLLIAKAYNKSDAKRDFIKALGILIKSIKLIPKEYNELMLGLLYAELLVSLSHLNRFDEARAAYAEAEKYLLIADDENELGKLYRRSCALLEPELSEPILRNALRIFKTSEMYHEILRILTNLSTVLLAKDKIDESGRILNEALQLSSKLDGYGADYILNNLGIVQILNKELNKALKLLNKARASSKRHVCQIIIENNEAVALMQLGKINSARDILERLLREAENSAEIVYMIPIRLNLALAYLAMDAPNGAINVILEADNYFINSEDHSGRWRRTMILKRAYNSLGLSMQFDDIELPANSEHLALKSMLASSDYYLIDMQFWGD